MFPSLGEASRIVGNELETVIMIIVEVSTVVFNEVQFQFRPPSFSREIKEKDGRNCFAIV